MKRIVAALITVATLVAPAASDEPDDLSVIFNGRDLTGWRIPQDNVWFIVDNGILRASSGPQRKGAALWTERDYADFVITLEFRFGKGVVDSGVFLRTEAQQIQIGISGSLQRDMTGSPYIAGRGYPVEAAGVAGLLKQDDWNSLKIQAVGAEYAVWLNGTQVLDFDSESDVMQGPVGLQLHSKNVMSIDFRELRLVELDAEQAQPHSE